MLLPNEIFTLPVYLVAEPGAESADAHSSVRAALTLARWPCSLRSPWRWEPFVPPAPPACVDFASPQTSLEAENVSLWRSPGRRLPLCSAVAAPAPLCMPASVCCMRLLPLTCSKQRSSNAVSSFSHCLSVWDGSWSPALLITSEKGKKPPLNNFVTPSRGFLSKPRNSSTVGEAERSVTAPAQPGFSADCIFPGSHRLLPPAGCCSWIPAFLPTALEIQMLAAPFPLGSARALPEDPAAAITACEHPWCDALAPLDQTPWDYQAEFSHLLNAFSPIALWNPNVSFSGCLGPFPPCISLLLLSIVSRHGWWRAPWKLGRVVWLLCRGHRRTGGLFTRASSTECWQCLCSVRKDAPGHSVWWLLLWHVESTGDLFLLFQMPYLKASFSTIILFNRFRCVLLFNWGNIAGNSGNKQSGAALTAACDTILQALPWQAAADEANSWIIAALNHSQFDTGCSHL